MARRNLGLKLLDERWVLTDQLIQLKGVVEFNERNIRWLQVKEELMNKNYDTKIRHVSYNVKRLRQMVSKYETGCVDAMEDVLKQDKEVYLICRKKKPDDIIENLKHMIFRQRKAVDKIKAEINILKQDLFDVELDVATLKEKVNAGSEYIRSKEKEEDEKFSAALESANTQNDVCNIVMECYGKINGVLKKDSYYFDDVIASLKNDAAIQSQTILKIIELGQLACEDFSWLRQEAKKSVVQFNEILSEHRREIKQYNKGIEVLEAMKAKLNEYGAKAYPLFQEVDVEPEEDKELEEMVEEARKAEQLFGDLKTILGVNTVSEVVAEMERLKTTRFELNKMIDDLHSDREMAKKGTVQLKALSKHMEFHMPEEVKKFIKEEEGIVKEIGETAESIQKVKALKDEVKDELFNDRHYLLNLKRMLWSVEIGKPENLPEDIDIKEDDKITGICTEEDPFGLFGEEGDAKIQKEQAKDTDSVCASEADDVPFKLLDLVSMKAKVLHDSIGDLGSEEDCNSEIMEAFGDQLQEEQHLRMEELEKFSSQQIVVKQFKPKYDEIHSQTCDKKARLQIKFMSRQLVVDNEISKEKGEVRVHMHPQGVYRGMFIEEGSSESSSTEVPPEGETKEQAEEKKEEDEESVQEESDIGYEVSEEEEKDSELDPNEPKPHICYN